MTSLSDYFRSQADWRWEKAGEYSEDKRNANAAAALTSLAEYVDTRAEDDAVVTYLERHLVEDVELGGEQTRRAVSRYGFAAPRVDRQPDDSDHEEFLRELCALCAEDAYEHLRDTADDHDEDLATLAEEHGLTREDVQRALNAESRSPVHFARVYGDGAGGGF